VAKAPSKAVLVFDVNETLLDLSVLDPLFEQAFGRPRVRPAWFLTMQTVWMTGTIAGAFAPFPKIADAALELTAAREQVIVSKELRTAIIEGLKTLPPYPEVHSALGRLRDGGVRLAALTNSTRRGARAQLTHAGLFDFFERVMSVEEVRRYKPAADPYRFASRELRVRPGGLHMVAAHWWDLNGAAAAGLKTVFVKRSGKAMNPLGPKPDLQVTDLGELAERFVARADTRVSRSG
jgi:2-haloacid dehalogenase